jgi:hypothetical protein
MGGVDLKGWGGITNYLRHSVPNSARLMYLSMHDIRDDVSESVPFPSPPSSFTHVHTIQSHTLLTSTLLTFMCTQVLWCLPRLTRSRVSGVTIPPIPGIGSIRSYLKNSFTHTQTWYWSQGSYLSIWEVLTLLCVSLLLFLWWRVMMYCSFTYWFLSWCVYNDDGRNKYCQSVRVVSFTNALCDCSILHYSILCEIVLFYIYSMLRLYFYPLSHILCDIHILSHRMERCRTGEVCIFVIGIFPIWVV